MKKLIKSFFVGVWSLELDDVSRILGKQHRPSLDRVSFVLVQGWNLDEW